MAVSQRVVAGVSIDERVSVGAYGAIHKAHTASRRDLRALMVDARLAGESSFSTALLDDKVKGLLTSFDHPSVVPTLSIAKQGDELVVVTVGPGRHATVAELLGTGGSKNRLPVEIAGAIAQAVVQALAAAHQRGLVHGAVHARSVAIDETGHVKLCDFAVGRALIAAVAQGADGTLAAGLTGSLPPEVALGEPPTPAGDVFAAGALLFTMLSGETPPGTLKVTPAVQRVVQRALDTDPARRFRDGTELLEALLESYDDDRWSLADTAELRKLVLGRTPAPVAATEGNLDDDTEDLLATLGNAARNVALTRPSVDIRAAAVAERQKTGVGKSGLDALLADLDPKEELTHVDDGPPRRDPISEIIRLAVPATPPAPSHEDDPEDSTPLPSPLVGDDSGVLIKAAVRGKAKHRTAAPTVPSKPSGRTSSSVAIVDDTTRPKRNDEIAALSAIADLDDRPASEPPAPRASSRKEPVRVESEGEVVEPRAPRTPTPKPMPAAKVAPATVARSRPASAIEPMALDDLKPIRLKSRFWPIVWTVIIIGGLGAAVYYFLDQKKQTENAERLKAERDKKAELASLKAQDELDDPGNVVINSEPNEGSVYMLLGRTPLDYPLASASVAFGLPTSQLLELRIELDSYTPIDTQIPGNLWSLDQGDDKLRVAKLAIPLKVAEVDRKGVPKVVLPQQPPKPSDAILNGPFPPGKGTVHIETTPPTAKVWLFIGTTNNVRFDNLVAGKDYEFRVLKDGFLPGPITVAAEEWRDGGDPKIPLSAATKKETLTKAITLVPDPKAPKPK